MSAALGATWHNTADASGLGGVEADLSDEYEWVPLRLPPDVTRVSASTRLSIEAEYRGWELTRVRLYTDGSRGGCCCDARRPPTGRAGVRRAASAVIR